jgi:uncharacterized membrane protein YcaP (DUF421 family)
LETVIRVAIIFVFITVGLRFLGKRELSEMSPYELVMIMLIPELATQGLNREDFSITNSLIGISTLLGLVFLNSLLGYRFKKYQEVVEGKPILLYYGNRFLTEAMHRERISSDEILSEMHSVGFEHLEQVKCVILEPDGLLTYLPADPSAQKTPLKRSA